VGQSIKVILNEMIVIQVCDGLWSADNKATIDKSV
jgi:hypothetical protein